MRFILVALFVVFASTNGVTAANLRDDIGQILDTAVSGIKTSVDSVSGVDGGDGQKFLTTLTGYVDNIKQTLAKVFDDQGNLSGNISDLVSIVVILQDAENLLTNYINAENGKPGTKEALEQITDICIKGGHEAINVLKATGHPFPQALYDGIDAFVATMEKTKASIG